MLFLVFIISLLLFLIPNVLIVWLQYRFWRTSLRIGSKWKYLFLFAPPVLLYFLYYFIFSGYELAGLIGYFVVFFMSVIAIDYCLRLKDAMTRLAAVVGYFLIITFCELVFFDYFTKM